MFCRSCIPLKRIPTTLWSNVAPKRLLSTPPDKKKPFYKRWLDNFLTFGSGGQSVAYDHSVLSWIKRADKVDLSQWKIVYHDFVASRISLLGSLSVACVGISILITSADYYIHGEFTLSTSIRYQQDFEELGFVAYICVTGMFVAACSLVRLHLLRILRIYQHIQTPDKFLMVRPGVLRFYKTTQFSKSQVRPLDFLYENGIVFNKLLRTGNIQINGKSAIINLEGFEDPTVKSYMFGERDDIPGKLNSKSSTSQDSKPKKIPPPPPSMF